MLEKGRSVEEEGEGPQESLLGMIEGVRGREKRGSAGGSRS